MLSRSVIVLLEHRADVAARSGADPIGPPVSGTVHGPVVEFVAGRDLRQDRGRRKQPVAGRGIGEHVARKPAKTEDHSRDNGQCARRVTLPWPRHKVHPNRLPISLVDHGIFCIVA